MTGGGGRSLSTTVEHTRFITVGPGTLRMMNIRVMEEVLRTADVLHTAGSDSHILLQKQVSSKYQRERSPIDSSQDCFSIHALARSGTLA